MRRSFQTVSLEEVFSETRGHARAGAANSPGPCYSVVYLKVCVDPRLAREHYRLGGGDWPLFYAGCSPSSRTKVIAKLTL